MKLWSRILTALEDGPGTAAEIALELELDARQLSVNLRAMWAAGYVAREPYYTEPPPLPAPRLRSDGWYRTATYQGKGRRLWRYSVLDATLVGAPMVGARS